MNPFSKSFLFLIFCLSFSSLAFGQFGNQYFMNQMMNQQMQMGLMYNYGNKNVNRKYNYTVLLKDSTKKEVNSKIHVDTVLHKSYLLVVDKNFKKSDPQRETKIYVDQTLSISKEFLSKNISTGMATDSCWLFKVIDGGINAYSLVPVDAASRYYGSSIVAIQKGKGPILPFIPANLKKMILSDANAFGYFQNELYFDALKAYNKNLAKKAAKKSN